MNIFAKSIRKLMGWCPTNAKANEAKRHISLENFNSDVPDKARGEGGDAISLGWLRKQSTLILLPAIFITSMYFLTLNQIGINLIFLLAGFVIGLIYFAFYWKIQMQRYDYLLKQPVIDYSTEKKGVVFIIIFLFYFLLRLITGQELAWQAILSLNGGLLVFFWLSYFQIKYWERMNHKTIFFDKKCGKWKTSYVIMRKK